MKWILGLAILVLSGALLYPEYQKRTKLVEPPTLPNIDSLPDNFEGREIRYGRELYFRTAYYIGPKGIAGQYLGNTMNCTNCHLDAGTQPFGVALYSSHANYPQYRAREAIMIDMATRINLCIRRPHQGKDMPETSREMRAMLSYMKWLATSTPIGTRRFGDELENLPFLDRAADPDKGKLVYEKHCQVCHGNGGEGKKTEDGSTFIYPPLWGPESYGIGTTMHRIIKAASFIRNNMPRGTTWKNPVLTPEEAFDVAAFVNQDSHTRKVYDISHDYPTLSEKPIDYPNGPYADSFSEQQHKYGPWQPIIDAQKHK